MNAPMSKLATTPRICHAEHMPGTVAQDGGLMASSGVEAAVTLLDGGTLYDAIVAKGAEVVGFTDTKGYEFEVSAAVRDGQFVGLVLDQDNQAGKSEKRIAAWTSQIL